jgi:hypothetical protein
LYAPGKKLFVIATGTGASVTTEGDNEGTADGSDVGTKLGDDVGVGVGSGVTHAVCAAFALLPAGHLAHILAFGPETCPASHFLHIISGEGE